MSQKEKTVQPSKDEQDQTDKYQKTRDLAETQVAQQVVDRTNESPSLQNADVPLESVESQVEKELKEATLPVAELDEKAIQAGKKAEKEGKVTHPAPPTTKGTKAKETKAKKGSSKK